MILSIQKSDIISGCRIKISGSKSESNRMLLLKALFPEISIENLSNSDDTRLMETALNSSDSVIDIHHAGTAMRFLTAYYSCKENSSVTLTGSERMKQRPIEILVTALEDLGANIKYLKNQGCPPLKIIGQRFIRHEVGLDANVSSQYISALMLIAPKLDNGLEIFLKGKITSVPYINMTLQLLKSIGVECTFANNSIRIQHLKDLKHPVNLTVESDWSSASYFYSIVALSNPGTSIELTNYKLDSLQGDSVLPEIYNSFGVETSFVDNAIILKKLLNENINSIYKRDLSDSPDLAQTIAVTCLGLGMECKLSGLHTLKIKETDRLTALKNEISKLNGNINVTDNSLHLEPSQILSEHVEIETYNDHRMAMAFAPISVKVPVKIKHHNVVSKSYPDFWNDLGRIGFSFS